MRPSVVILTYNSAATIEETLRAATQVSDDVFVVDSYSSDETEEIVAQFGAKFIQRDFKNYADQRNWAIRTLELEHGWQLHLDADEKLSPELVETIQRLEPEPGISGYFVPRLVVFLGREIRHGGMYPLYHMRLFRNGHGRCEDREYDQHFLIDGKAKKLSYPMIDNIAMPLNEWTARHNRWADMEANEIVNGSDAKDVVRPSLTDGPIAWMRFLKVSYYRAPLFLRCFALFIYRYIFRLGFLDGRTGLIFFVLQSFWFRFLVDAKIYEMKLAMKADE